MVHPSVHHIHVRKRIHKHKEKYPHPHKWKRLLDTLLLVLAGVYPLANIPQLLKIFLEKTAAGVSMFSWVLYTVLTIPWILYGFLHKEKLIIFAYTANFLIFSAIVTGIAMYG
jgi:uncharacterized protein with PQ loop repeat